MDLGSALSQYSVSISKSDIVRPHGLYVALDLDYHPCEMCTLCSWMDFSLSQAVSHWTVRDLSV